MNEQWSEQIFDSMLEEVVTGKHPPDLSAKIRQAWSQESSAMPGINGNASLVVAKAIVAPQVTSLNKIVSNPRSLRRKSWMMPALCVAASVAFLISCVQYWRIANTGNAPSTSHDDNIAYIPPQIEPDSRGNETGPKQSKLAGQSKARAPLAANDSQVQPSPAQPQASPSGPEKELMSLENLPFASSSPLANNDSADRGSPQIRSTLPSMSKLSEDRIVETIDSQLQMLWKDLNVLPTATMDDDSLVRHSFVRLTGVEPNLVQIAGFVENKTLNRQELIESLVLSPEFANYWSDAFAKRVMYGTEAANAKSESGKALREALSKTVQQRSPWNYSLAELIDSSIIPPNSELDVTNTDQLFLASLAGGGNHRLASRIGVRMLDSAIACTRCHDGQTTGDAQSLQQSRYWSLVALLMGIEAGSPSKPSQPTIVDKQLDLLAAKKANPFFELPDGRMQRAEIVLPDGSEWTSVAGAKTPRQALARWLIDSQQLDRAVANQAWRLVFGRPLVPTSAALDGLGLRERHELLALLGTQFRLHNHDVGKLVSWLASSDAFARGKRVLDRQSWLLATDHEKAAWSKAEFVFAAQGLLGTSADAKTLVGSLAAVTKWSSIDKQGDQRTLLAQPDTGSKPQKSRTAPKSGVNSNTPAMEYLVHRPGILGEEARYVDRLVSSKLTWKQQIEHVVGVTGDYSVSRQVEQLADRLRSEVAGGPREALLKLLWAVRNHDAS